MTVYTHAGQKSTDLSLAEISVELNVVVLEGQFQAWTPTHVWPCNETF